MHSARGAQDSFLVRSRYQRLAEEMTRAGIELVVDQLVNITLQSTLLERIRKGQMDDAQLQEVRGNVLAGVAMDYSISGMGLLWYKDRISVPMDMGIR